MDIVNDNPARHHSVCVPNDIRSATVELIAFRGAPVFLGTELAKLLIGDEVVIIRSRMSGVVNRVSVENDQVVHAGDDLFELRNVNTVRDKAGNKMTPYYFKERAKHQRRKRQDAGVVQLEASEMAGFSSAMLRSGSIAESQGILLPLLMGIGHHYVEKSALLVGATGVTLKP